MKVPKLTRILLALSVGMIANTMISFSWLPAAYAQEAHDHAEHADEAEHDDHEGHDHAEHADEAEHDEHEGHDHADEAEHDDHEGHDHAEHADEAEEGEHDRHDHEEEVTTIELSPAIIREFGIETAKAGSGSLRLELRVPGEVVPNPNFVAHVVPRAPGIAQSVRKQVGDPVKAGELLAVLDSPELSEAKADYHSQLQEQELDRIDLERAQEITANTRKALAFLKGLPALSGLAELEGLDLGGMRRELIGSYAAMVAAETTLQRKQKLHEQKIASDAELQEAQSAYNQARAEYIAARDAISYENERSLIAAQRKAKMTEISVRTAERHLHALGLDEAAIATIPQQHDMALSRLEITSPIDGIVTERHLVQGEKVGMEEAAFVVASYHSVWVYLTLYQKDVNLVKKGMPVRLVLSGADLSTSGTVDLVSPEVEEGTRTATARVVVDNASGTWRPGSFVTGRIAVSTREGNIVVPRTAIVTVDDRPTIFVKSADGFEPRPVQTGMSNGGQVEILHGLKAGDVYVSRNALPLKAELNRAALEHAGHAH